ncbi:PilZ domain-containing protein [Sphingomonas aestuarii]
MTEPASSLTTTSPPRARRFKMFHVAEMRVLDARVKVHVVNLSTSGLMLRSDAPPSTGTTAIFDLGIAERRGRVVWCQADRCGVQFLVPLTDAELDVLTAPSAANGSPARVAFERLAARFAPSRG